jgi:hypothetical protein
MFCEQCGCELPAIAKFCGRCGTPVARTPSPLPSSAISPSVASPPKSTGRVFALVGAIAYLALIVLVFTLYWAHQKDNWASAIGHVVGSGLIPAVIVLIYYKTRKMKVSATRILIVLASWVFVGNIINIGRNKPPLTEGDIPIIAREAAGLAPITKTDDANRTAVRECFKEVIQQNRGYQAEVDRLNFDDLYTPSSYVNARKAEQILAQLQAALDIETGLEAGLNGVLARCEERFNTLGWSESYRKKFVTGFEEQFKKTIANRRPKVDSAKAWLNSIRDLYLFVLDNQGYFYVGGNQVRVSDPKVLAEFNEKLRQSNKLESEFEAASKLFNEQQKAHSSEFGVSPSDFGLAQEDRTKTK